MADERETVEAQLVQAVTQQAKIDTLNVLALETHRTNVAYATELANQAYALSQQGDFQNQFYYQGMIEALVNLAIICDSQNTLQESLQRAYDALALCDLIADQHPRLGVLLRLAWACFRLGNYSKALEISFELLTLAQQLTNLEYQAHAYNIIGAIYGDLSDYEKCINYLKLALPLFQKLGNVERERAVYGNFCMAYRLYKQYDTALEYGLRSLQMSVAAGDIQHEANILSVIGDVYYEIDEYITALDYYRQGLSVSQTHGFTRSENLVHVRMARIYFRQGKYDIALVHAQRALEMADQAGYRFVVYQAHEELSKIYEQQAEFLQALHHYRQFHQIRDAVLSQEQAIKLQNLQISYETEQTRREAANLQRLREEELRYFEKLSKMKDELIGTASHDLKSPLTTILLGIDLLREHGKLDDVIGQTLLHRLDTSAEQMRELISDLLDLARLETGQGLHIEQLALKPFLAEVVETFQPLAQKRGITLLLDVQVKDVFINGDSGGLRRVINNLLSNAIKYTQVGGEVSIYAELKDAEIVINIKDTGIGIPTQDLPHLFERFYRVHDQAHQIVEGTGLGLAIVKSIIEQHGGTIWVESQQGIGSVFSFTLQRVEVVMAV